MMILDMTLHDKTRVLFEHSNRQLRFRAMGQEVEKTHMACMVTSGMEHTICQIHSWVPQEIAGLIKGLLTIGFP